MSEQFCAVFVLDEACAKAGDACEMELAVDLTRVTANFGRVTRAGIGFLPASDAMHFVTVCLSAAVGDAARCGFWLPGSGVHVVLCDPYKEEARYVPEESDRELYAETRRLLFGERSVPLCEPRAADTWESLAGRVNSVVMTNVAAGPCGTLLVPGTHDINVLPQRAEQLKEMSPFFGEGAGRTPVWSRLWPSVEEMRDMSGADITKLGYDGSARLRWAAGQLALGTPEALVGELQMAFVHFLVLASMGALTQWKALVQLFCACDPAVDADIIAMFLDTARSQLSHSEIAVLLEEEEEQDGTALVFLRHCFGGLYDSLRVFFESHEHRALRSAADKMRKMLVKKCGYDPESDDFDTECAAVVTDDRQDAEKTETRDSVPVVKSAEFSEREAALQAALNQAAPVKKIAKPKPKKTFRGPLSFSWDD